MYRAFRDNTSRTFLMTWVLILVMVGLGSVLSEAKTAESTESRVLSEQFLTTSQLREGMRGVAKTVVHGVKIEEFDVEIIGVVPDLGASGDAILARVSGPVIEKTGGVVQGMSGSPVYIDGKLVGAVSGAFRNNPDGLAVITPIESMLDVMEKVGKAEAAKAEAPWENLQTPLLASGLSSRAFKRLADVTKDWGLQPIQSGGGGKLWSGISVDADSVKLEPGSAVGMQWVRGDVNLMAVGTVTYVDGDRFVAFGHTAGNWGDINTFASTAYVNGIVRSTELGFKLASPLRTVGSVTQDRFAAIGGRIGALPPVVEYKIKVTDQDTGEVHDYQFEVVRSERFTNQFAATALLGVLDRSIDRLGSGTSRVVYRVAADNMETVVRDNLYYSAVDISAVSLGEVLELTDLLIHNEFKPVNLKTVELDVQVGSSRQTAVIERVKPERRTVEPGQSVNVEVVIRPYRGQRETKIIRLDIPKEVQPGTVHVTARGGASGYLYSDNAPYHEEQGNKAEKEAERGVQPPTGAESLEKLVRDFTQRARNQEIVVEFIPYLDPYNPEGEGEAIPVDAPAEGDAVPVWQRVSGEGIPETQASGEALPEEDWNEEAPQPVRSTLATSHYIEGELGFDLTIVAPAEDPSAEGSENPVADEQAGDGKASDEETEAGDSEPPVAE